MTPGWRVSEDVGGIPLLAPLSLEAGPRLRAGDVSDLINADVLVFDLVRFFPVGGLYPCRR